MNLNGQVLTRGAISDHGDPLERPAALIERDLREGYLTPEGARHQYGYTDARRA